MMGIVISGTRSGVGKTTISTAIMGAMDDTAPFKAGPDYIDPRFHEFITKKSSYNLDIFICGEKRVRELYYEKTRDKFGVVEGVMGLYDGLGHGLDNGSTAHLARTLGLPVILVVDAKGGSTSIAAQVLGYKLLDTRVKIGGVILNNVSSEKLYRMLSEGVEKYAEVECVGYFPRDSEISLGSRHLGLKQAEEMVELSLTLEKLRGMAKKYIDIERIREIAKEAAETIESGIQKVKEIEMKDERYRGMQVAVARDSAFTFYYRYNIELLTKLGVKINYFSPLANEPVPEKTDFIYIGGGYPENFARELSENRKTIESIRENHERGVPIYGECGGYMYLASEIKLTDGSIHPMCEILDGKMEMKNRLNIRRFGYIDLVTDKGTKGRAHEFHYSGVDEDDSRNYYFDAMKTDRRWRCGEKKGNTIGGYPHIHFLGNENIFEELFGKGR